MKKIRKVTCSGRMYMYNVYVLNEQKKKEREEEKRRKNHRWNQPTTNPLFSRLRCPDGSTVSATLKLHHLSCPPPG